MRRREKWWNSISTIQVIIYHAFFLLLYLHPNRLSQDTYLFLPPPLLYYYLPSYSLTYIQSTDSSLHLLLIPLLILLFPFLPPQQTFCSSMPLTTPPSAPRSSWIFPSTNGLTIRNMNMKTSMNTTRLTTTQRNRRIKKSRVEMTIVHLSLFNLLLLPSVNESSHNRRVEMSRLPFNSHIDTVMI